MLINIIYDNISLIYNKSQDFGALVIDKEDLQAIFRISREVVNDEEINGLFQLN